MSSQLYPESCLSVKVFSCTSYVQIHKQHPTKLDRRSVKLFSLAIQVIKSTNATILLAVKSLSL